MEEPILVKDWIREKTLGSGGFGVVALWRNDKTKDQLAIKKCKPGLEASITPKHRERWIQEVNMMIKLSNHPNIVSYKPLPEVLEQALASSNLSQLPMLSMEYCTGGDLRETLNRSANCCGLPEVVVRDLLLDIKTAIQYLHSNGITHRDLKPENIVLQQNPERLSKFIYKLTDLGYAKELDAKSLTCSLVGTLQYLAPDILHTSSYSNSVDYWSFGIMAFEIICGVRPLLPFCGELGQWVEAVKKKSSDDICIFDTPDRKIHYSQHMHSENHISKTLKTELEKWLKVCLEWDPKKRGRHPVSQKLIIFEMLEQILSKKILIIFSVYTYQFLSYEIDDSTLVSTLQVWIKRDINIPVEEQFILTFENEQVRETDFCSKFWDKNSNMLLVFRKGYILAERDDEIPNADIPRDFKPILSDPYQQFDHLHQKRIYAQGLYFVFHEGRFYDTLLDACVLKLNYLIKKCTDSKVFLREMSEQSVALNAQFDLINKMLKFDLEQVKDESLKAKWMTEVHEMGVKVQTLRNITGKVSLRYESAFTRALQLNSKYNEKFSKEHDLIKWFKSAQELYHDVKSRPKEIQKSIVDNCYKMYEIITKSIETRINNLKDLEFRKYMQQINDITKEYEKIIPTILNAQKFLATTEKELLDIQLQRQRDIWSLPIIKQPQFILGNPNINLENTQSYSLEKPLDFITGDTNHAKVNNVPMLGNRLSQLTLTNKSLTNEAAGIINDNLSLRTQLRDLTNESFSMVHELLHKQSTNLESLVVDNDVIDV